jgi:hypothetical protein
MRRYRALCRLPGAFCTGQSWADCITNPAGPDFRQAQVRFGVGFRTPIGALPALSARPATDGSEALIVAPISRYRIDPGRDAPRVVVSPAMPQHASLVLRRGRHVIPVRADLLIAGASGRLQIIVPGHGRPDINIGLGAESPS